MHWFGLELFQISKMSLLMPRDLFVMKQANIVTFRHIGQAANRIHGFLFVADCWFVSFCFFGLCVCLNCFNSLRVHWKANSNTQSTWNVDTFQVDNECAWNSWATAQKSNASKMKALSEWNQRERTESKSGNRISFVWYILLLMYTKCNATTYKINFNLMKKKHTQKFDVQTYLQTCVTP